MKLEIKISKKPVEYQDAIKFLEERVIKIQNKNLATYYGYLNIQIYIVLVLLQKKQIC